MTKISYIRGIEFKEFMPGNPNRLDLADYGQATIEEVKPANNSMNGLALAMAIAVIFLISK